MAFINIERPGLGTALGGAFGGGFQTGLQDLLKAHKTQAGLQALGIGSEKARQLSSLDPQLLREVVKGQVQSPGKEAFSQAVSQLTGGAQPGGEPGEVPEGVPGEQQEGAPQAQLRPEDALKVEEFKLKQQEAGIKRQESIERSNRPYTKRLAERSEPAREIASIVQRVDELMRDPTIQTGALQGSIPTRLQNAPTQELVALFNDIVARKSDLMKGQPNKMRVMLLQLAKPNIWQNKRAMFNLVQRIGDDVFPIVEEQDIANQLIEENNGQEPKGFKTAVRKRTRALKELGDPTLAPPDQVGTIGNESFQVVDGQWVPVGGR